MYWYLIEDLILISQINDDVEYNLFFNFYLCIYLFSFGCAGSSLLHTAFLQLQRAGAILHWGAGVCYYCGFFCCGAWAPVCGLQWLWCMSLVVTEHATNIFLLFLFLGLACLYVLVEFLWISQDILQGQSCHLQI